MIRFPSTRPVGNTLQRPWQIALCSLSLIAVLLLAACAETTPPPTLSSTPVAAVSTPVPPDATPIAVVASPTVSVPSATPTTEPAPIRVAIEPDVSGAMDALIDKALDSGALVGGRPIQVVNPDESPTAMVQMSAATAAAPDQVLAERVYAVVAPFATISDEVSWAEIQARWTGGGEGPLFVSTDDRPALVSLFGAEPVDVVDTAEVGQRLAQAPGALAILPFDQLEPTLKVLAVGGINPIHKDFQPGDYPLILALTATGPDAAAIAPFIQSAMPVTNRDASRLTTLIMTGVTAMSRGTAAVMEEKGYTYPALVISDTLSAADITHVSNEVPFIKGCKVNNTYMNLVLCSDYPYLAALQAIGTDIVGLSGNHVNDFGREGALESLQFYKDHGIPVYGSGLNEDAACAPLMWTDHGNTFAFIATLAWWPEEAWATKDEPGACYFYNNYERIFAMVRQLSQQVDVVSIELQYEETYDPWPTDAQVAEFRALHDAGADIVTGVQSHVPQSAEPYSHGIILYGLGNLFFDQMESWETRTSLIARDVIYEGHLISTELLTTVLEDYAQPRWATEEERAGILQSIFDAQPPAEGASPSTRPRASTPTPMAETAPVAPPSAAEPISDTLAATSGLAHPHLPWPSPAAEPEDHDWLVRPLPPDANQLAAPTYPFGGTAGGQYRIHHGNDIANPLGTPVLAAASASVAYAGPDLDPNIYGPYPNFYGNVIVLRLDRTWDEKPVYVLYGHLNQVLVNPGDHVDPGQPVGAVGMTGIAIGPHLHVEMRLGGVTYEDSANAALWMSPLAGAGTVAGQVVTPDGLAWHDARVQLYRLNQGRVLYRITDTYADDPGLRPDPVWAENFVFGDVPAGDYELVVYTGAQISKQTLQVEPDKTSYARFVVAP